ncbi:MAG: hypothetical protein HYZ84_06900, partial [Candidatus Omnitrophica bacterium]|nr:hypothetical protein [Candidatus Omnitrophota bacterium]
KNGGIRGYTHVGDHLRIGATAIEEQRQNVDYDLRGVDAVLKLGRNSRISAEYAEAKHQQVNQSVSYNGGLSFRNNTLLPGRRPREGAFVIKAETKPMKNLETSGYIQEVQAGFSNEHIKSQEGLAKHGLAARYKITDDLSVRYRYDSNSLGDHLRPLLEHNVQATFDRSKTHVGQITYDDSQWLLQAEYMHQNTILNEPNASIDSLYSAFPFENVLAGKVGYHLNERLLPYAKVQTTVEGKPNHQFGGGVRYQVAKDMFAYMEEMIGNFGDSTYLGFEKMHDPRSRSYANVRMFDRGIGHSTLSTTIGSSYAFTEKSRVYSERENSTYHGTEGYADILGYEGKLGDHWDYDAKFARRHLDDDRTVTLDDEAEASLLRSNSSNTISGALGYANGKKLRARTSLEYRHDQDVRRLSQWVIRDSVEYQVNQDLSFLGRLDFGWSRFMDPDDTPAGFAEFSTGFAYRPVDFDRFNALMRYTYDKNIANDLQFQTQLFSAIPTDETSHIVAIDLAYDLFKHLGIVEKVAFKRGIFDTPAADPVRINQFLWGHRFNYHITRKWDIAAEYHILLQSKAADNFKHGFLTEVDRELYDYVRLGLGYNFSDFDDDLRSANDYDSHGPYVRLSGKF